jgi:hypothetical protein
VFLFCDTISKITLIFHQDVGILSQLFTALDALYLAYLRVRYPTGNYNTDSSDSSEEDEEY